MVRYLPVLPAAVLLLVFLAGPVLWAFHASMTNVGLTGRHARNSLKFTVASSQIAVRSDVAADAGYQSANPFVKDVSGLVSVTRFRPATSDYPRISAAVQEATEAVITGKRTPEQAAADYDAAVAGIVGADKTIRK